VHVAEEATRVGTRNLEVQREGRRGHRLRRTLLHLPIQVQVDATVRVDVDHHLIAIVLIGVLLAITVPVQIDSAALALDIPVGLVVARGPPGDLVEANVDVVVRIASEGQAHGEIRRLHLALGVEPRPIAIHLPKVPDLHSVRVEALARALRRKLHHGKALLRGLHVHPVHVAEEATRVGTRNLEVQREGRRGHRLRRTLLHLPIQVQVDATVRVDVDHHLIAIVLIGVLLAITVPVQIDSAALALDIPVGLVVARGPPGDLVEANVDVVVRIASEGQAHGEIRRLHLALGVEPRPVAIHLPKVANLCSIHIVGLTWAILCKLHDCCLHRRRYRGRSRRQHRCRGGRL